jgi:hypothetical protein
LNAARLVKCPAGYRVYRSKLGYGLWHVLCVAQREGFLPALTEETVWQMLHREPFTTPLRGSVNRCVNKVRRVPCL